MTEIVGLAVAAQKMVSFLYDVKNTKEDNVMVAHEIDLFVTSLWQNIDMLNKKLPDKHSSSAVDYMKAELEKASTYLGDCLSKGYVQAIWNAKETKAELIKLRQNLVNNFQITIFITTFEVVVDGDKKVDNFLSKMLQLSALSASRSEAAISEIRELVQSVVVGMRTQPAVDEKIKSFVSMVRENEKQVETSSETQKFFADVLANLALEDVTEKMTRQPLLEDDRDQYCDPFTHELICDPVKCRDGRTYDRFSIIEQNLHATEPMVILCDDVNMRGRLFQEFNNEGVESKYHKIRNSYREQALLLANKGHYGEATAMLNYVLQWAPNDIVCLESKRVCRSRMLQHMETEIDGQKDSSSTSMDGLSATTASIILSDDKGHENLATKVKASNAANTLSDLPDATISSGSTKHSNDIKVPAPSIRPSTSNRFGNSVLKIQKQWKTFRNKWGRLCRFTPKTNDKVHPPLLADHKVHSPFPADHKVQPPLFGHQSLQPSLAADLKLQPSLFSFNELKEATKNFHSDNALGEGTFGIVYKGLFRDGTALAVKRLVNTRQGPVLNEFLNEIVLITNARHSNLVQLRGCCINDKERILLYEYMECGNLAEALWGNKMHGSLNWQQRLNICLGVARGLSYLHTELNPAIIHRDIKPANVLLDKNCNPKIADFGLATMFLDDDEYNSGHSSRVAGTIGYLAPEYAMTGLLTDKGDVYSFGILILEIVSGRRCIDRSRPKKEYNLLEWAKGLGGRKPHQLSNLVQVELREACDKRVIKLITIALLCSQYDHKVRPTMCEVVKFLVDIISSSKFQ